MSDLIQINNGLIAIGGNLVSIGSSEPKTYTKSYSGDASPYAFNALSSGNYIDLEPRTYHIEFSGTFSLYQADEYSGCQVAIFGDDPSIDSIYSPVTFTYISPDTKTVTIEGSADIDPTQRPDLKYFAFLRDYNNIIGTVVGTITATRYT